MLRGHRTIEGVILDLDPMSKFARLELDAEPVDDGFRIIGRWTHTEPTGPKGAGHFEALYADR